jgi:ribonuclease P/MRP protein subunit POP5
VVRVSGTIRKAEQEAIKQAREMVIRARRETELHGALALEDILGEARPPAETDQHKDVLMLDASDSEDGALTDGDG